MKTIYKVNWDNGASACGTFHDEFETHEDASDFASDWVSEMCAASGIDPDSEEAYFAEVFESMVPDLEGEGWDQVGELHKAGLSVGRP